MSTKLYSIALEGGVFTIESDKQSGLDVIKQIINGKIIKLQSETNDKDITYYTTSSVTKVKEVSTATGSKKVIMEII